MQAKICLLPGDGIGPEIVEQAHRVLLATANKFGHEFTFETHLMGGCAIDDCGEPLPAKTLEACRASDAILLGAVGGPKWDDPRAKTRPEIGLLQIRKELGLFANLRPVKPNPAMIEASPLKPEIVEGTDILFVRELTGGIYFGEKGREENGGDERAFDVMAYSVSEIERVTRVAGKAAMIRNKKLASIDKANVLEVSRLWRETVERVVKSEFPELDYSVVLVDAMAMHLISRPADFDVVLTPNMFGDILSDEASMIPGSLGLLPSASLGDPGPGLYEPIHGSAPDIAGKGLANPLATILAAAMLVRHELKLESEAAAIESAVESVLDAGFRTADIGSGSDCLTTEQMGTKVIEAIG